MLHKDVLEKLMPIKLDGVFPKDIELEGKYLDLANESAEILNKEIFSDTTSLLIANWEKMVGITGGIDPGQSIQARRDAIVTKLRARGVSNRQDFIDLAAKMGFTITINEPRPPRAGIARAGVARVYGEEIVFCWQVTMITQTLFYTRAGIARAGDRICWKDSEISLESILIDLKPAHTYVTFIYP